MKNSINISMLDYMSTTDDDEMNNGVSKSTCLEPTIKKLINAIRLCRRKAQNLVRRGHNKRSEISLIEKLP